MPGSCGSTIDNVWKLSPSVSERPERAVKSSPGVGERTEGGVKTLKAGEGAKIIEV
jgi:hypothetical protein